jgi:alpha-mannosidase
MHWVDMQWLWGYDVLPGSVDDMLAYCRATGVKGNINFDGIGYEKLASESPEHIAKLREAIKDGTIEVVGGSYGQPYGLFHGGESNVRQRVYGVRTAIRVLGCRPKTFWEEEFDAYPQLPQMLKGCGFTGASLYFQWTWHTPEVPMEEAPVVLWEGVDGTQIPSATRNRMNLHQWPEDFQILLNELAANPPSAEAGVPPLVLQWLELMPTQDWMCRSELMIPMLTKLKEDPRFEILAVTLGEYLEKWQDKDLPVRKYQPDDFWHGMTLGKNGDNHPKRSAELEHQILEAETASAILGLFGRPYEPWDVYPTWELEECWRNLLAAQHHDNHECEGLCGHVAEVQFSTIKNLLMSSSATERLAKRVGTAEGKVFSINRYGWPVSTGGNLVPGMGYGTFDHQESGNWTLNEGIASFEAGGFRVVFDVAELTICEFDNGLAILKDYPLKFIYNKDGAVRSIETSSKGTVEIAENCLYVTFGESEFIRLWLTPYPETQDLHIYVSTVADYELKAIDPGYGGAVRMVLPLDPSLKIISNGPYSISQVGNGSKGKRKYPTGDWMTSPQWFEDVEGGFTSQSIVNMVHEDNSGLLLTHSLGQQWVVTELGLENVLLTSDPWDEKKQRLDSYGCMRLFPHNGTSHSDSVRRTSELQAFNGIYSNIDTFAPQEPALPLNFSAVTVHSANVLATAFYREQESFCKRGLETYAGEGMGHPYVLRLVEYDGITGDVEVTLPGPIANAFKTNLMGEIEQELSVQPDDPKLLTTEPEKLKPFGVEAVRITVPIKAHEIATLYLDIIPGRKQFRDLDAKREIWATVHRVED